MSDFLLHTVPADGPTTLDHAKKSGTLMAMITLWDKNLKN